MTNDVETLNELFSTILVTMVKNGVLILGYAGVMLYLNWRLALISFVLLPLAITGVLGLAAVVLVHEVAEVVVIANGLRAARARKQ